MIEERIEYLPVDADRGMLRHEIIGHTADGNVIVLETWNLAHSKCPIVALKRGSIGEKDPNVSWVAITTERPKDWQQA